MTDHKIYQWSDEEIGREYWECTCGACGSAPEGKGDLASDRHIKPGESRSDTNRPLG